MNADNPVAMPDMSATLLRICELQPSYTSTNSPAMRERGFLVRTALADHLRNRLPYLRAAFDPVFDDVEVSASDGIGRKTEAPWVRLSSKSMSPNPREGFYVVIHFAADGSAVFLTVGCGSTILRGGDLRPVSDEELETRTSWARSAVVEHWGTLAPFEEGMALGAKADLPRTFEKATALARRIPATELDSVNLDQALFAAAERLNAIYKAQLERRDVSAGDVLVEEIALLSRPTGNRKKSQGIGLSAVERKVVELRAMELATTLLASLGYACEDVSSNESYDIRARKDTESIKVEVKGTTSDVCESILMTKNEVDLHRLEKGRTCLIVVSGIKLDRSGTCPSASGGQVELHMKWDIDQWVAQPVAFQITRKVRGR
jgi:hypothetical protein